MLHSVHCWIAYAVHFLRFINNTDDHIYIFFMSVLFYQAFNYIKEVISPYQSRLVVILNI